MTLTLIIPGEPVTKARPRVTKAGITYTPAKTVNYETFIQELFAIRYRTHVPFEGALICDVRAFFGIPKSWTAKKKKQALERNLRPTSRKDWDNLGKIISDALNGLAYRDDGQIVDGRVRKWYSDRPRVEIEITEIK